MRLTDTDTAESLKKKSGAGFSSSFTSVSLISLKVIVFCSLLGTDFGFHFGVLSLDIMQIHCTCTCTAAATEVTHSSSPCTRTCCSIPPPADAAHVTREDDGGVVIQAGTQ